MRHVDLNATVRFTGTQFVIKNGDSFDWENVKLDVNSHGLSSGFVYQTARMRAGETYFVGAMQFAQSDGVRFNPFTLKVQNLYISATTPEGQGDYLGEYK